MWIALAAVFALRASSTSTARSGGSSSPPAYLIEKALSVDNIFVIVIVFGAFGVPAHQQHRVLFWGILGALAMRAVFIVAGTALIARFHWTLYVFGVFLVVTGVRMLLSRGEQGHPENNVLVRLARKVLPVAPGQDTEHFFTRVDGRRMVTPLFLALLAVEFTDLIFAVDSIPAVLAVSQDPFIVFTSNIFAILGLRSLYFLLAGVVQKFRYLKVGLALVLVFVGVKMTIVDVFKIPVGVSLAVVAAADHRRDPLVPAGGRAAAGARGKDGGVVNKTRFNIAYALVAVMAVLFIQDWVRTTQSVAVIPYSQFQKLLEEKKVAEVTVGENQIRGTLKEPIEGGKTHFATLKVDKDIAAGLEKARGEVLRPGGEHLVHRADRAGRAHADLLRHLGDR